MVLTIWSLSSRTPGIRSIKLQFNWQQMRFGSRLYSVAKIVITHNSNIFYELLNDIIQRILFNSARTFTKFAFKSISWLLLDIMFASSRCYCGLFPACLSPTALSTFLLCETKSRRPPGLHGDVLWRRDLQNNWWRQTYYGNLWSSLKFKQCTLLARVYRISDCLIKLRALGNLE